MRRALAALGLALALTAPAAAQSPREFKGAAPGTFDFYVLALSWSPGFCDLEGREKGREQCEPGRRLGFTVHGLWPQYEDGYPAECGTPRQPTRAALEEAEGVFPDLGLARYEWRRHGTCSGESPAGYFRDARRARDRVRIPDCFADPDRAGEAAPIEIERAFAAANPGLRPDMMAVACRRGVLQEVRICLDRNLADFRRCPEIDRSGCRFGDLTVSGPR